MTTTPNVSLTLPAELAAELDQRAKAMGLDVASYIRFLEQKARRAIDPRTQDAIRFMFSKHSESLRKLGQ